jgi:hypothetical protein
MVQRFIKVRRSRYIQPVGLQGRPNDGGHGGILMGLYGDKIHPLQRLLALIVFKYTSR